MYEKFRFRRKYLSHGLIIWLRFILDLNGRRKGSATSMKERVLDINYLTIGDDGADLIDFQTDGLDTSGFELLSTSVRKMHYILCDM